MKITDFKGSNFSDKKKKNTLKYSDNLELWRPATLSNLISLVTLFFTWHYLSSKGAEKHKESESRITGKTEPGGK